MIQDDSWNIVRLLMSKISVQPDINHSRTLKPTAFPAIDLSSFQLSHTSTSTQDKNQAVVFPDQSKVKFRSGSSQKLPNLFQYNNRAKLSFSSDEEEGSTMKAIREDSQGGTIVKPVPEYKSRREEMEKMDLGSVRR